MTPLDQAIALDLAFRAYCLTHGLNLHEVRTASWEAWNQQEIERITE